MSLLYLIPHVLQLFLLQTLFLSTRTVVSKQLILLNLLIIPPFLLVNIKQILLPQLFQKQMIILWTYHLFSLDLYEFFLLF